MNDLQREKYVGALLGAAIGDALGWPKEQNSNIVNRCSKRNQEFLQWDRKSGGRYWAHQETILPGEYSDDTQLLLATLRSLLRKKNWSTYFRQIELPSWLVYERGGGGATKRAAKKWERGISPWDVEKNTPADIRRYFMAGGNGVAMRILPHVFMNEDSIEDTIKQVLINGMYTHGHPRALVGAVLYACAASYLLQVNDTLQYGQLIDYLLKNEKTWGGIPKINNLNAWLKCSSEIANMDYEEVWNETVSETVRYLKVVQLDLKRGALDIGNETLRKLGCFDKKVNGAGNLTAVASFYLFSKYASNPKAGIIEAANLPEADTDTVASMTGGLLGALHGQSWIPLEWHIVQDYSVFSKLVDKLFNSEDIVLLKEKAYKVFSKNALSTFNKGHVQVCMPFGYMELLDTKEEKVFVQNIYVQTFIFRTDYGQTVYAKKMGRVAHSLEKKSLEVKNDINKFSYSDHRSDVLEVAEKSSYGLRKKADYPQSLQSFNMLIELSNIFQQIDSKEDFIELIVVIIKYREQYEKMENNVIKEVKAKFKSYSISTKQIEKAYSILQN